MNVYSSFVYVIFHQANLDDNRIPSCLKDGDSLDDFF